MVRCMKYRLSWKTPVIAIVSVLIPALLYHLQADVFLSDLNIYSPMKWEKNPDHLTIVTTDEKSELDNFKDLVKPYIEHLERVRDIFREVAPHRNFSITNIQNTAEAAKRDYFDRLAAYTEIKTLFLRRPLPIIKSTLRQEYYQYGSSDCDSIDKASYGKDFCWSTFHKTCQEDLEKLIEAGNIEFRHFNLGLPEFFNHSSNNVTLSFLSIVPNAVIQPNGDVRYKDLRIIPQRCQQDNLLQDTEGNIYEEVFTVAQYWGDGFYHGTVEDLPRLSPYIEFLKSHPSIFIHVASRMSFMVAFMDLLGIASQRVISGNIKAQILYLPAGSPCGRGTLFSTQMLSAYMRNTRHNKPQLNQVASVHDMHNMLKIASTKKESSPKANIERNGTRNTVILQKRSQKRYFRNHDAIAKALKRETDTRGLKLVIFSDKNLPSLNETIQLFDSAVLVIAPHGAGESNMIFARPGTPLIEGLCKPLVLCYRNLMQNLGLRYYGILQRNIDCFSLQPRHLLPAVLFFLDHLSD